MVSSCRSSCFGAPNLILGTLFTLLRSLFLFRSHVSALCWKSASRASATRSAVRSTGRISRNSMPQTLRIQSEQRTGCTCWGGWTLFLAPYYSIFACLLTNLMLLASIPQLYWLDAIGSGGLFWSIRTLHWHLEGRFGFWRNLWAAVKDIYHLSINPKMVKIQSWIVLTCKSLTQEAFCHVCVRQDVVWNPMLVKKKVLRTNIFPSSAFCWVRQPHQSPPAGCKLA